MYRPTFAFDCVGRDDPDALRLAMAVMGEAVMFLARVDLLYLREYSSQFPPLYESGVVYGDDRPAAGSSCGDDDWRDVAVLYRVGVGDCEELAAARLSQLWAASKDYVTCVVLLNETRAPVKRPEHLFHIMLRWPYGLQSYPPEVRERLVLVNGRRERMLVECPSEELGMPSNSPRAYRSAA